LAIGGEEVHKIAGTDHFFLEPGSHREFADQARVMGRWIDEDDVAPGLNSQFLNQWLA
jgi:hypothetical protein